jgi:DNA-directed RNA polymerase subunit RPC12/RpoP
MARAVGSGGRTASRRPVPGGRNPGSRLYRNRAGFRYIVSQNGRCSWRSRTDADHFQCSKCEARLEIDAESAGAEVECPTCGERQVVPRKGLEPGTTIGGFKLVKLIGAAGWGRSTWRGSFRWTGWSR